MKLVSSKSKILSAVALLLSVAFVICSFAGCDKNETPAESTTEAAVETTVAPESDATEEVTTEISDEAETFAPTEPVTEEETTEGASSKPETKEEVIAYYNENANRIKSEAKEIMQNYALNTQTRDAVISNKMLSGIANKLISANMGYDKKAQGRVLASAADKSEYFPVKGQTWTSKLTVSDVVNATCTENGDYYDIVITLIPDTTPNIKLGQGHAGKAISIVTKDSIVEGAGTLGMSVIEEESINLTYKDCKITVKVEKETGNIIAANYYQDWTLSLTAIGIDVTVAFGIEDDYTISW